ncbi:MAG: hypothetical protein D6722_24660, partial [Bacteroidetes bacterium]
EPGRYVDTPAGRVQRTREGLARLSHADFDDAALLFQGPELRFAGTFRGREVHLHGPVPRPAKLDSPGAQYLDADQIAWPLTLRGWEPGDRMNPLGMKGKKKLKDIFTDEKFSPLAKARALVLADANGVIALSDFRIAHRVRVRPETQRILQFVTST